MGYIRRIIRAGNTVEVEEHFSNRYGFHDKRGRKENQTPEQVRRAYIERRKKQLRWLMNENFKDGRDALLTLSWRKGEAPKTLEETKHQAELFVRRLRAEYKAWGLELKYIYCVEIGPRGSRHIHIMVSNAAEIAPVTLYRYWDGIMDIKVLYTQGQYGDIANYMVKQYAEKTALVTGGDIKRCFETSRNLKKPEVTVERIREKDIRKEIKEPEGMILDKASVRQGVGKITGRPYRFYRLLITAKVRENVEEKTENCARATGIQKVKNWIGGILRRWRR